MSSNTTPTPAAPTDDDDDDDDNGATKKSFVLPPPPQYEPKGSSNSNSSGKAAASTTTTTTSEAHQHVNIPSMKIGTASTMPPPPPLPFSMTNNSDSNNSNNNNIKSEEKDVLQQGVISSPPSYEEATTNQQQNQHTNNNKRGAASPLASRQSSIPVLIVPTAASELLAEKNGGLRLAQLFGALAGSAVLGLNASFRSVGRSFLLDVLDVSFVDGGMMDEVDVKRAEAVLGMAVTALKEDDGNIYTSASTSTSAGGDMSMSVYLDEQMTALSKPVDCNASHTHAHLPSMDIAELPDALDVGAKEGMSLVATADLPWYRRLRLNLDSITDFMSHEMIDCPIMALLMASSSDADFIECFRELMVPHHLPRPFHTGHYDPGTFLRRHFVLLHDNVDGPPDFNEAGAMAAFNKAFPGQLLSILRINSVSKSDAAKAKGKGYAQPDLWVSENADAITARGEGKKAHVPADTNNGVRGCCLSPEDMLTIRSFVFELTKNGIIPEMEKRIFNLNVTVSNNKKGVKNVLKSLWRKPKESDAVGSSSKYSGRSYAVKYTYDQIESQVRLLADSLFLMKDYEAALSTYRLVKGDYASDKAYVHFASINEMIALCMIMTDPTRSGKDIYSAVENALFAYARAADEERFASSQENPDSKASLTRPQTASLSTRLATRLCLVACSYHKITDARNFEYAECMAGASTHETPLVAAVLLEQAASQYLRESMLRKYSFHLLMAGHMYRASKQEKHGTRCFTAALHVYQKTKWGHLHDHLLSSLAHQAFVLDKPMVALQLYASLASSPDMSGRMQTKVLQNLFDICDSSHDESLEAAKRIKHQFAREKVGELFEPGISGKRVLEIPYMNLPRVLDESIVVVADASSNLSNEHAGEDEVNLMNSSVFLVDDDDINTDEKVWDDLTQRLEAELSAATKSNTAYDFISALENGRTAQMFSKNKPAAPKDRSKGEPFVVAVNMVNPLDIPLKLTNVQLVALHEGEDGTCSNVEAVAWNDDSMSKQWIFASSNRIFEAADFLHLSTFSADPYFVVDKQTIGIDARSMIRSELRICPLTKGKLKILGMRYKIFDKVWSYHEFTVLGPLLQKTQSQRANRERGNNYLLSSKIGDEMPLLNVDITGGKGSALQGEIMQWRIEIKNLGTAPASNVILKASLPWVCQEGPPGTASEATSGFIGLSGTVMSLPIEKDILPNEAISVPVKVKANGGGRQNIRLLFRYNLATPNSASATHNDEQKYIYLRKTVSVAVYPSMNLTASIMPSFTRSKEHILSVELTNYRSDQQASLGVELVNFSIMSKMYKAVILAGQLNDSRSQASSPLTIGWQERVTLHLLVLPLGTDKAEQGESSGCVMSDIKLLGSNASDNAEGGTHAADFLCLENAFDNLKSAVDAHHDKLAQLDKLSEQGGQPRSIHEIRRANTGKNPMSSDHEELISESDSPQRKKSLHPTSIAALCSPKDNESSLSIICSWKSIGGDDSGSLIHGEHFIRQLSVRKQHRDDTTCPFTITAKYCTRNINHDFSTNPLLEIDVELIIRNQIMDNESAEFEFRLDPRVDVAFIGAEHFSWSLRGGDELVVPLKAVLTASGIYNIQSVCLAIDGQEDMPPTLYRFPNQQWIVRVNAPAVGS